MLGRSFMEDCRKTSQPRDVKWTLADTNGTGPQTGESVWLTLGSAFAAWALGISLARPAYSDTSGLIVAAVVIVATCLALSVVGWSSP